MEKSDVYSWRLSPQLKSELVMAARGEQVSLSNLLERMARDWLAGRGGEDDEAEQKRLRQAASAAAGAIEIEGASATNVTIRAAMGTRSQARHARTLRD